MPVEPATLPLTDLIAHFLAELQTINRAPATIRTYATDLRHFVAFYPGPLGDLTAMVLTQYLATLRHLAPASRARKQAALASFCAWATANMYLDRNPMLQVPRVRPDPPRRYGLAREQVEAILARIPKPVRTRSAVISAAAGNRGPNQRGALPAGRRPGFAPG